MRMRWLKSAKSGACRRSGRDVEDAQFAGQGAPVHLGAFLLVQAGVDERGGYAV